ncbi:MAG: diguanylate cyclase [Clostridium butyricum]|mgnify:CR=1 FL=1|jgi:diguanylate cyclase (GGDEF)-like protein|uniref:GGDEF domain-containing protein n=1 Tax=Clostridium butyricum TaxID=1492 RepID=UPI0003D684F0|nr:MAG: Diguanylate cyclase [Clostridium butyricum DORA_1]MDK2827434.1 diguanylate cyclase [Clostridium butyricum]MDU1006962.1 GGDEF domain-containing protein [Clostridium butyricum]MDU1509988.1 GGDEF domain-containing protein [Clostridium butyricum]
MSEILTSKEKLISKMNELISNNEGPFSIVVADIDNLKNLNNVYGDSVGDEVINKIISILTNNLSSTDMIYKIGDEFNILLVKKGAERSFMELEEIRRYLSDNTFRLRNNESENIYFTLSLGVASYPRDAKNVVELFRVADTALYRAKQLGKNRICLSEAESMVLKSNYFTKTQLDRLSKLSKENDKTEAFLLREALDDLFKKYSK